VVRPTDLVPRRERLFDDLQLMVDSGLEFEDHAAIAEGFRFENNVPLTTIGDRVARVQFLDRHRLRSSVFLHPNTVGQFGEGGNRPLAGVARSLLEEHADAGDQPILALLEEDAFGPRGRGAVDLEGLGQLGV